MKKTFKMNVQWVMEAQIEVEAESYSDAISEIDIMPFEKANIFAEFREGSFQNDHHEDIYDNRHAIEEIKHYVPEHVYRSIMALPVQEGDQ